MKIKFIKFHLLAAFIVLGFAAANCYSGEPLTYGELNTWYQTPPSGSNAAKFVLQAANLLQISPSIRTSNIPWVGAGKRPGLAEPLSASLNKSVADFLILNRAAYPHLRRVAALDQSRYPVDYTRGVDQPLPHLKKIKDVTVYLSLLALYEANGGESSIAAEAVAANFGVAKTLQLEPDLISQLVRWAVIRHASDSLEDTFNRVSLTRDSLRKLRNLVSQLRKHESEGISLTRALVGDRLSFATLFALTQAEADAILKDALAEIPSSDRLVIPADQYSRNADGEFLDALYARLIEFSKLPENERFRLMTEECLRQEENAFKKGYVLGHLSASSLKKVEYRQEKISAYLRLAEAAIWVESQRSLSGAYPETLGASGLVGVERIKYEKEGRGYELTAILPIGSGSSSNMSFRVVAPRKVTGR